MSVSVSTGRGRPEDLRRRNRRFGIFSLVLAGLIFSVFARGAAGLDATFRLDSALAGGSGSDMSPLTVPVAPTAIVLGVLVLAVAILQLTRGFGARTNAVVGIATGLFILAFLTWAARGTTLPLIDLLRGSLRAAVPLTLGALAGVLCERSGVINIAIEGQLLGGAFVAAVLASVTDSAIVGAAAGILAGALIGALLAVLAIRYRTDQIVVGVILIVLVSGLTGFLTTQVLADDPSALNSPTRFSSFEVPLLADIPIVGPMLFDHTPPVYIAVALVFVVQWALFKTRWGLRLRSVGEHPMAADTVGIRVLATRYRAVILGGVFAGFGGAFLTLDASAQFIKDMSGGKGFIALAAMLAGRYNPRGALGAALVFGFADALATALQILNIGVPSTLMLTAPYVATLIVVAGLIGRLRMPAADGQPYIKE